jgi:hypothetical protein
MLELYFFLRLKNNQPCIYRTTAPYAGLTNGRLPDTKLHACCVFIIDGIGNMIKSPPRGLFRVTKHLDHKKLSALREHAVEIKYDDIRNLYPQLNTDQSINLLVDEHYKKFLTCCLLD